MIERRFTLPLEDGRTIRGDLRLSEGEPPRSAIAVVHGFKGFKDWGFFPYLCECLAHEGHAVASLNFSLNGIGDDPTEFTELEAFARNTFSRDVGEILHVLGEMREGGILPVPPTKVGLLGHSRGGGEAILAADRDRRVDALVTWAAIAYLDRWPDETKAEWRRKGRIHVFNSRTGQEMPLDLTLLEDYERNRESLDIEAAASRLGRVPWLIVHGEEDTSVSVGDARRLKAADPHANLEIIPGAGHGFEAGHPFQGSTPELDRAIRLTSEHFRRHLLPSDDDVDERARAQDG